MRGVKNPSQTHEDGNIEHIYSKIVFYIGYPLPNCSASFFKVTTLKNAKMLRSNSFCMFLRNCGKHVA